MCIPIFMKNMSKGFKVIEPTSSFPYKIHSREITQKGHQGRATILAGKTPSLPDIHVYHISSKYLKRNKSY